MNRHDNKLELLIGKRVKVTWFDGTENVGILGYNNNGRPMTYSLTTDTSCWTFYKSHIKKVKEC